jgi:hypothetical protein
LAANDVAILFDRSPKLIAALDADSYAELEMVAVQSLDWEESGVKDAQSGIRYVSISPPSVITLGLLCALEQENTGSVLRKVIGS